MATIERVLSPPYFKMGGAADRDKWVTMGCTDGYWEGFVRPDSSGLSLLELFVNPWKGRA